MHAHLLYQQPLPTLENPPPQWSWPVPLSDGRVILTLLYHPPAIAAASVLRTLILELAPDGSSKIWPPALGYPAPVIFHANHHDQLLGLDLTNLNKIYACLPDGTHRWSLEASLRMDCPIAPRSFHQIDNQLHWIQENGTPAAADLTTTPPTKLPVENRPEWNDAEVHFLHTHLTRNGNLFVLDFDPTPRITRYHLTP